MKIHQNATLTSDPVQDMDAVNKRYVDNKVAPAAGGGVFFIDITPTSGGIVGNKAYVANTVPANKVITDGTSDTNSVRVTVFVEGAGSFYSPTVTITTSPAQAGGPVTATLAEDPNDKRAFTGYADLTNITADTTVTATSSTGGIATTVIHRAAAGPVFNQLFIGGLPGSQTEVKAGDLVSVTGKVTNDATVAELVAGGANNALLTLTLGAVDSGGTGYRTITGTFTVSSQTGLQGVQARAKNSLGTYGGLLSSTNQITLNQTYPTIGARTITYPSTQNGIKGVESATVAATITNADVYSYAGTNLSVASPTTYAASKTVTRTGGTYVYGTNNYTITATKSSNAAVTVASSAVAIADTAPTGAITIGGSPARLRSSPAGQDYIVTLTANQRLNVAPVIAASSGTWQGSWTGSGTTWTRTLRIIDTDQKGNQTFTAASLTGLANAVGTTLTSGSGYIVGGFPTRTITFPAFSRYQPIGTTVGDVSKLTASYTGATVLTFYADTGDHFQGFSIVDSSGNYDANGGYLYISDSAFAGSNTTGTLQLDIAEAA